MNLSERTLITLDILLERLREVRAWGFAVSVGENTCGLRIVAAPVLDAAGPVAGGSFTSDAERMRLEALGRTAPYSFPSAPPRWRAG